MENFRADFSQYASAHFKSVEEISLKFPNLLSLKSYDHREATPTFTFR